MLETVGLALLIFFLRILGNAITTMRLVFLNRDQSLTVAVLGFFESLTFAVALGFVVTNLDSLLNLLMYCLGYAVGSHVGFWLERRLTLKYVVLNIISREGHEDVANAIREAGFGATTIMGHGAEGQVYVVESVVERHNLNKCMVAIQKADPDAFITTQNLSSTRKGFVPAVRPGLAHWLNSR